MSAELNKGNILPLVKIVQNSSFGGVRTNKKTISDIGWYPANFCLLTDPNIMKSRVVDSTLSTTGRETDSLTITIPNTTAVTTTATSTAIVLHNKISTTTTTTYSSDIILSNTTTVTTNAIDPSVIVLHNTTATTTTTIDSSTIVLPNTTAATTTTTDSSAIVLHTIITTTATNSLTKSSFNITIATPVYLSPQIDLSNVNFENGLAGDFTIDIIQHFAREKNVVKNLNK